MPLAPHFVPLLSRRRRPNPLSTISTETSSYLAMVELPLVAHLLSSCAIGTSLWPSSPSMSPSEPPLHHLSRDLLLPCHSGAPSPPPTSSPPWPLTSAPLYRGPRPPPLLLAMFSTPSQASPPWPSATTLPAVEIPPLQTPQPLSNLRPTDLDLLSRSPLTSPWWSSIPTSPLILVVSFNPPILEPQPRPSVKAHHHLPCPNLRPQPPTHPEASSLDSWIPLLFKFSNLPITSSPPGLALCPTSFPLASLALPFDLAAPCLLSPPDRALPSSQPQPQAFSLASP